MRTFLWAIFFIALMLLALGYAAYAYYLRNGSIEGVAYIRTGDQQARPLADLRIYLLRGNVGAEMDSLEALYDRQVLLLEGEVLAMRHVLRGKRDSVATLGALLESADAAPRDRRRRAQLQEDLDRVKHAVQVLAPDYQAQRGRLDALQHDYNQRVGDTVNRHKIREYTTTPRGRFTFTKILRGTYYVYALYGGFTNTIAWLEPVDVAGRAVVRLSQDNTTNILK